MKRLYKKLQLFTFVLLAGLLFFSTTLPVSAYIQKDGTVSEAVALRQNADEDSKEVMQLTAGQEVKVNNELTDNSGVKWYQVFVNGNTIGYVPASTVSVSGGNQGSTSNNTTTTTTQTQTQTQTQTVTTTERVGTVTAQSAIRVREDASTSSDQVASMEVGDTFLVLDEEDAADGHIWYKVEFDDHGTTVYGYVRSDLVSVKEVTKEEEVQVEVPVTPSDETVTEPPYSVISQKDAEGATAWYILEASTGEATEISSLLSGNASNAKADGGIYKILMIVFLLLLIVAVGGATFFYMRWQEAEDFIDELHEKQQKAKRPQAQPQQRTAQATKPASTSASAGIPGMKPMPKPVSQPMSRPASQPMPRPVSQPLPKPTSQPLPKPAGQPMPRPVSQPAPTPVQPVTPNTVDVVSATQRELQNQNTAKANPNTGWKSKNFLTDDYDELEFDFLDMDDKE